MRLDKLLYEIDFSELQEKESELQKSDSVMVADDSARVSAAQPPARFFAFDEVALSNPLGGKASLATLKPRCRSSSNL